ncbi:hypothetical protein VXO87_09080, partial [Acinetobacter baumannii]|uniref:hypothetical protein n=1 Tax=Acinetobacter baumannii TaxID=470 RepID=UPI003A84D7C7
CCFSMYIFMATFIGLIMNSKCQQTLDKRALYFIVSSELLKELCLSLIRWFLQSKQGIDQRKSEKYLRIYLDK